MYSDLIDRARKPDSTTDKRATAESYLFQSILNGNHPTLVLSQTFDSELVLSLLKGNQSKAFLSAFEKGLIHISPYAGAESIQEYLLQVLTSNIEGNPNSFYFSCFPFLYSDKYTNEDRRKIFSSLRSQLQNSIPNIRCDLIDGDERQLFNEYTELIHRLNQASFTAFLVKSAVPTPLHMILQKNIKTHLKTIKNTLEATDLKGKESLTFYEQLLTKSKSDRRTDYYNYLELMQSYSDISTINEARELIDYSYNETIASSICDKEPANLNIPNTLPVLTATAVSSNNSINANKTIITPGNTQDSALSWGDLAEIVTQVNTICEEKTCNWQEGLRIYSDRQQRLPFIISSKYAVVATATLALSSIPFVGTLVSNVTSELLWSAATDAFGECMKKPSFKEIIDISKASKKKCDLIKAIGSTTSVNINSQQRVVTK